MMVLFHIEVLGHVCMYVQLESNATRSDVANKRLVSWRNRYDYIGCPPGPRCRLCVRYSVNFCPTQQYDLHIDSYPSSAKTTGTEASQNRAQKMK